jgi:TRAP-type C4-dicarboxylate transport system permease large subunit
MKNTVLQRIISFLPGLFLALALAVLLVSSLLRYAEAMPWLPQVLRTINISMLHQFATDFLIAMTLIGAANASRTAMPRQFLYFGLVFSLFMITASVWQGYQLIAQAGSVRFVFWLVPLSSLLMISGFIGQIRTTPAAAGKYFPVSMGEGGIKTALLFGVTAFAWSVIKLAGEWKILAQYYFDILDQFTLSAIPFLVLAGVALNPHRRSGNLVPFAMLALWYAAITGIAPGKFIFALLIPGALVAVALFFSGAKNIVFAERNPAARLLMYGAVCVLFVGTMVISFVSFTEGAALAAFGICAASLWIFRTIKPSEVLRIFAYSAEQSAGWMFTGATVILWVRLIGDVSPQNFTWFADVLEKTVEPKSASSLLMLVLSMVVCAACYFVGPIAAILIATVLLMPLATAINFDLIQMGAIFLMSLVLVKIFQTNRVSSSHYHPDFNRNKAMLLTMIVLLLVTFVPKLSLRLPLLVFGPGQ